MRSIVALVLTVLLAAAPLQAQEALWCQSFDFTKGEQGWTASYIDAYGRYTPNTGYAVTDYGNTTSYELGGSIRLQLDFSGTIRQLYVYAFRPDFDHIFVDWDSEVSDAEPIDDSVYASGGASPAGIAFDRHAVDGRLGLELVKTEAPLPMTTVVTGIVLTGTGSNPFGAGNCADSGDPEHPFNPQISQPYDVGLSGPFPELFQGLTDANAALDGLPGDLTRGANGLPLLPSTDGSQVFGYAKWLLSSSAADEYAGPFAPLVQHLGIFVTLMFALIVAYVATYLIVYLLRFVIWLVRWLLKLMDLVLQAIQASADILLSGAKLLIRGGAKLLGLG